MKPRHHLYLDDELTAQLDALAAKPGTSKSAIVADALRQYLGRRGARELDEALRIRLDRQSRQLERIERDVQVLLESVALFVRYQLTVTAPLPEPDKAARAVGQERFQKFIDQVSRQMAAPTRTLGRSGEASS
ncbi:ribbon-helix-helix CopG family protein [Nitrospirillum amazonense]|uniref:Ribbon-helix-helix CopG family protein n=1 Tax=Nitrospirillum amazonense TaxID=28077 RepID=A0A560K1L7_9PROT|nr:CopG family transcriptional regulator [Nitrospirillum amazonense]TWB77201.1 ribbon-helix-helix CopG family protein [Nitrospirillum amazonense]